MSDLVIFLGQNHQLRQIANSAKHLSFRLIFVALVGLFLGSEIQL